MSIDIELLKYPIGKFQNPEEINPDHLAEAAKYLKDFPRYLTDTIAPLDQGQLSTPYRPGGWTVIQLLHHIGDSHMNALIRFKLALTESTPTIKPYEEAAWAELADYALPIEPSLQLILAVHAKWAEILENMGKEQFESAYFHPESKKEVTLAEATLMYHWHSMHHLAHIQHLMIREKL